MNMNGLTALQCVQTDDIYSLRIICNVSRNNQYSLEEMDEYGNTALLKACYLGKWEAAHTLLRFGASIRAINYFGQNALTLATHSGHFSLIQELLSQRSYEDFNLSSIFPALCVAILRQNQKLIEFFKGLNRKRGEDIHTVHGLYSNHIQSMLKPKNTGTHRRSLKI